MEEQAARLLEASQIQTREQLLPLIERGQEAEKLLCNPVLEEWFKGFQDNLLTLADEVPLKDTLARDRIYMTLGILRKLKADMKHYAEEGITAKDELSKFLEFEKKGLIGRLFNV